MRGMSLVICVPTLSQGGAERVACWLAENLSRRGHTIHMVTAASRATDFFPEPHEVERTSLKDDFGGAMGLSAMMALWRIFHSARPDLIVSFLPRTNVASVIAGRLAGCRVVVCERSDPRIEPVPWRTSIARALTYPFSAGLVLQTNAASQWARRRAPFGQLCVIPNAVTRFAQIERGVKEELVLGVGRLSHEKRFDRLIRSFAAIALDYPLARLRIVGDGPLRKQLRSLADSTGFGPRIELPGAVLNISAEFNRAKLFALTSDFEGFPNALLEAMSLGLPVISLDCPSGPAEIVTSGINGILVPRDNENDLVLALRRILDDPKLAMRLGVKAKEVTQTYASESILGKWETFLWSVVSGRRE